MKFVLCTGGVVSGLGKGITISSIGVLLKECGLSVTCVKIDPYINVDAGTMSPFEHGECFVLDDGGETDLDLGNYERFMDLRLGSDSNITTGKVYNSVIQKERRGDYLGKTVQMIPHITDEIQERIWMVSNKKVNGVSNSSSHVPDVTLIELGGTIGDLESGVFVEALRQLQYKVGKENFCHVHVSYAPVIGCVGEIKSKPTQNSVRDLRALGLSPDIIVCRSSTPLTKDIIEKISMFCMVDKDNIFGIEDVNSVYKVPLLMLEKGMARSILGILDVNVGVPDNIPVWEQLYKDSTDKDFSKVRVGIIGKYTNLKDAYLSVIKALTHASMHSKCKLEIEWIESSFLEEGSPKYEDTMKLLKSVDGVVVPGGFGGRGVQGKKNAIKYCRENKIPFLGICLGFQLAVVEFCQNVLGIKESDSVEFNEKTKYPCIIHMKDLNDEAKLGGTMRLGLQETVIKKNTQAHVVYSGKDIIKERHRHRYEVNTVFIKNIESNGMIFSGSGEKNTRMEILEIPDHPFFMASQFHPEFLSRPYRPAPMFLEFIKTSSFANH